MPKDSKFPRLRGRIEVELNFGKALDFSRYAGQERDRFVLRSVTDEIQYEIMQLSRQEYVEQYASRSATIPLPESARMIDDLELSDEVLAG
jgi:1-acyl-sn-glycerol-3-phosphate acyltransferase